MPSTRRLALVGGVVAVCLVVALAWHWREASRRHRAFLEIQEGASEASILATFGQPQEVGRCGESLWWGHDGAYRGKNDGRCQKWIRYRHFLGGYGVGFDAQGRVVSKYEYASD
jgi:hypothetical protein